ncbi:hypothetical protein [Nocardia sp. alder85J]|uniref:hypothetical protein n=1 Tax=Nocardia sp. alder85J TaxID=2862949 RepID=UPI001CD6D935|nr:hypothetical protein [Nocardia sp. alder85J]MCX4098029.1 hypothetical protein [Nocardia sp. alder85J]
MYTFEQHRIIKKVSDEILDLVDQAPNMDRGDVQAVAEAIALKVVNKYYKVDEAA